MNPLNIQDGYLNLPVGNKRRQFLFRRLQPRGKKATPKTMGQDWDNLETQRQKAGEGTKHAKQVLSKLLRQLESPCAPSKQLAGDRVFPHTGTAVGNGTAEP